MNRDDESGVPLDPRTEFGKKAPFYLKLLVALVISLTHDRELAEDIAQQAIVNYLEMREADGWQKVIKNEEAYLKRIARNLLNDKGRAESKTKLVSFDQPADEQGQQAVQPRAESFDVDKYIYLEELRQTIPLQIILGRLSDYQKKLLWLHEVEGMKCKEIGKEVNKDPAIVRYELQKIHATIRARVKKIFGDKKTLFKTGA